MPAGGTTGERSSAPDVIVVGAGVAGLSVAWRSAVSGLDVCVIDPRPLGGASWVAAGMLAPVTELHYGEEALLELNLTSARRFPAFVAELEEAVGRGVEYLQCGTLAVATDAGDREALGELHAFHQKLGLESEVLGPRECRRLEPLLSPSVRGGILVAGDHQVDNRLFTSALLDAVRRAGVEVVEAAAVELDTDGRRVLGVTLSDRTRRPAGQVVLAAGAASASVGGLPPDAVPPVRPVKGQLVRLGASGPGLIGRNLRALVAGSEVYLAPRRDGTLVVGATAEERGEDTAVTAGAVYCLLRDAVRVVPGVTELEVRETCAGLRPGTPDNAPLLGPTTLEGLTLATGHYRNGLLLAPVTGDGIAAYLSSGQVPPELAPFSPLRFRTPRAEQRTQTAAGDDASALGR
jgi:glycine oxidase